MKKDVPFRAMPKHEKLWFTSAGEKNLPPLLMLHGFMGSSRDWEPIVNFLSDNFYCIIPDLPGHGNSPLSVNTKEPFQSVALELYKLVRSLTDKKINLLGYSMGGRLALHYVLYYPESVASLIMESANPGIKRRKERRERLGWEEKVATRLEESSMSDFLDYWFSLSVFKSIRDNIHLRDKIYEMRKSGDPKTLASVMRLLGTGRQRNLWKVLPDIKLPVLLICGANDKKYISTAKRSAELFPDAHLSVIPDAGHNTHLENPEAFIKAVQNFLMSRQGA